MKKVVLAAVLAFLLAACTTTHMDESALPLIGYWYGEFESDSSSSLKWVVARHADGTYWASFTCSGDEVCDPIKEHGVWGLDDNVYWVKTLLLIDETGPYYPGTQDQMYYHTYDIVGVSNHSMEYQDPELNKLFRLQRVSKQFAAEFEDAKLRDLD